MKRILAPALLIVVFALLAGCGNNDRTRFVAQWKDPSFTGAPFKKIAVFAVIKDEALRRTAEDEFVKKLPVGTQGVAGYSIASADMSGDLEKIRAVVKQNGCDGVVLSRLAGKEERRTFVPGQTYYAPAPYGYYNGFGSYYSHTYNLVSTPGYTETEQVYRVETNVYNVADEKLVWTGLSESVDIGMARRLVDEVVGIAIKELKKQKLISEK